MLNGRSQAWMFTINNPQRPFSDPPIDFGGFRSPPQYAIYQLEIGENGTHHLQGYVYFETRTRGSTLSRSLGGNPHLEIRRGKHSEVIDKTHLFFSIFFLIKCFIFLSCFLNIFI